MSLRLQTKNQTSDGLSTQQAEALPPVSVLYGFFIIAHERRRILHFNVIAHPTSIWVSQQLREAFPYVANTNYLILDHDAKYRFEVSAAIRGMGIEPLQTALRSPWQNGAAERWVGSCRRELLDHVIPANERLLRRLVSDYVSYYQNHNKEFSISGMSRRENESGKPRAPSTDQPRPRFT